MVLGRDIPKINGWNLKIHPIEKGKSNLNFGYPFLSFQGVRDVNLLICWVVGSGFLNWPMAKL